MSRLTVCRLGDHCTDDSSCDDGFRSWVSDSVAAVDAEECSCRLDCKRKGR